MSESEKDKAPSFDIKVPKGTRDFEPIDMTIREQVFSKIKTCFKRHGAVEIDTPVFELKSVLTDKYGEDSMLIYDLSEDQGEGEKLSLRYDLTVPFARYVATHGIKKIKRYHIAKVYRRDQPYMTRGRYREFYQCDYDIAGKYDPMIPDADCIKLIVEIMQQLEVNNFQIRMSHRGLLDGFFEVCGVPNELMRAISSAVDKLDKKPWDEVRAEMLTKGLNEESANKIKKYVVLHGAPRDILKTLNSDQELMSNNIAKNAIQEMSLLFDFLEAMNILDFVSFDLSLARGLDYYTGLIFEVIHVGDESTGIGSICGGGRYDNLVGRFCSNQIPSVGFSVGVERILAIKKSGQENIKVSPTEALVVGIGVPIVERFKLCNLLWSQGINCETYYKENVSARKQFNFANTHQIPYCVIIGENELKSGTVSIKDMKSGNQETHSINDIITVLKKYLGREE